MQLSFEYLSFFFRFSLFALQVDCAVLLQFGVFFFSAAQGNIVTVPAAAGVAAGDFSSWEAVNCLLPPSLRCSTAFFLKQSLCNCVSECLFFFSRRLFASRHARPFLSLQGTATEEVEVVYFISIIFYRSFAPARQHWPSWVIIFFILGETTATGGLHCFLSLLVVNEAGRVA